MATDIYQRLDEVRHLRSDLKWTQSQIAAHFGCSRTMVVQALYELGYPRRQMVTDRERKRCRYCGHVYTHCLLIFGINKCPKCWRQESFDYINPKNGQKVRVVQQVRHYTQKEMIDTEDIPWHPDQGCSIAAIVAGGPVTCQKCPFNECIEVLQDRGELPRQNVVQRAREYVGAKR